MTIELRRIPANFFIVFVLLILAVNATGYFYYQNQKSHIKKARQDELLAIADLKVNQIAAWRNERMSDGADIFANFLLVPYMERLLQNRTTEKEKKAIIKWMESFRESYQYADILLLDNRGSVILSVSGAKKDIGPETKTLVATAIDTRQILFSDLYPNKALGEVRMGLVVPIINGGAGRTTILGAMLLTIDPWDFLYPLIQSWPTPSPSAETMLIRREGEEVVYLNDLRHRKDTALVLRLSVRDLDLPAAMVALGKEGVVEGVDYRGAKVLAATRIISGSPWFIVSKVDAEEVYAPVRARLWNVALIVGLAVLLAAAAVILIWHRRADEEQKRSRRSLEDAVKDRTAELRDAYRCLQTSYRDMESFSYSASHDLRAPLIAIAGFTGRLLKNHSQDLDEKGRELLFVISQNAKRMEQLINDIMAFSKVSAQEVSFLKIDTEALVAETYEALKPVIGARTVALRVKELPTAYGDPPMVRQVFSNLLLNAIKFTEPRELAVIEVGGEENGEENTYYVRDNGVGFNAEQADKLFGFFQRLKDAQKFEGSGVGLFIVRRIIEKHGGKISAEGKPDEGATFYFTLPATPYGCTYRCAGSEPEERPEVCRPPEP